MRIWETGIGRCEDCAEDEDADDGVAADTAHPRGGQHSDFGQKERQHGHLKDNAKAGDQPQHKADVLVGRPLRGHVGRL